MPTNIVILGSCRFSPYEVLAPNPIYDLNNNCLHNTEEGYKLACEKFYPAIDKADLVIVYIPDRRIGEHTQRDLEYALQQKKHIVFINSDDATDLKDVYFMNDKLLTLKRRYFE